jgi:two-component system chemotaxis response regulator CheV
VATGNAPIENIADKFTIITEYNMKSQGFLVQGVERIININWEDVQPPPKGTGHDHFLTAVTKYDNKLVEIIDVEKILADITPMQEDFNDDLLTDEVAASAVSKQVLIVDDSKIARKQIQRTLEKIGLTVVALNDGREAHDHLLALIEQGIMPAERYPIIISDIEMPEMDGYTLVTRCKSDDAIKGVYIMLHTSLSGVFNKAMVQKVGADDFMAKFSPDELAERVMDIIDGK